MKYKVNDWVFYDDSPWEIISVKPVLNTYEYTLMRDITYETFRAVVYEKSISTRLNPSSEEVACRYEYNNCTPGRIYKVFKDEKGRYILDDIEDRRDIFLEDGVLVRQFIRVKRESVEDIK